MARGFTKFRLGRPAHNGVTSHHGKRDNTTCSSGGFYKSPTASQTVQAGEPIDIAWDTLCMSTTAIDIYLYEPKASQPRIHLWENVNFALGSYQTTFKSQWWNSTSTTTLQLAIVPSGTAPFLATLPAGPLFTASYTASDSSASQATSVTGAVEQVNNFATKSGPSKGKIAAAVLVPILIVIALIVGAYIKINRARGQDKRKRWSEAVDKRMSTISTDWKSISAAGASAAIRNSMAVSNEAGNRASAFSFGAIRPVSTVAVEGGQAGIGAKGLYQGGIDTTTPQMTQLRSGLRNPNPNAERVSRVSFAADPRPSSESRRTTTYSRNSRTSRAFHVGHVPVPPLPSRQDSDEMSPTQTSGPLSLTAEDIQARMSGHDAAPRPSVDEVLPALSMMRTGGGSTMSGNDDFLLPSKSPLPTPPAPAQIPKSSIVGIMPMQPMPANVMSPDEMLRAYAQGRSVASPPPTNGGLAFPAPVANYNGNGMRVLYSPTTPDSSVPMMAHSPDSAYYPRKSLAPTEASKYDEEDAYVGTAE